ncbi:hypothetical protein V1514DRAFT_328093 [Lipomyces japonicus]|uniref:uncharacterized protein n=1 Tax=Lipomyces japonicus TaxID=56871 RepID=UPI0034CDF7E7
MASLFFQNQSPLVNTNADSVSEPFAMAAVVKQQPEIITTTTATTSSSSSSSSSTSPRKRQRQSPKKKQPVSVLQNSSSLSQFPIDLDATSSISCFANAISSTSPPQPPFPPPSSCLAPCMDSYNNNSNAAVWARKLSFQALETRQQCDAAVAKLAVAEATWRNSVEQVSQKMCDSAAELRSEVSGHVESLQGVTQQFNQLASNLQDHVNDSKTRLQKLDSSFNQLSAKMDNLQVMISNLAAAVTTIEQQTRNFQLMDRDIPSTDKTDSKYSIDSQINNLAIRRHVTRKLLSSDFED